MKAKRVLHFFGSAMNAGGSETFIMNVYRNIDRRKLQFDFAVTSTNKGFYDEEIKNLGGNIIYLPHPKKDGIIKYYINTKKIIEEESYIAVHSHVSLFSGINLIIGKNCGIEKRIAHSHTNSSIKKENLYRKFYNNTMRSLIHYNATIKYACSSEAGRYLYWNDTFIILKNGIDLTKYENLNNKDKKFYKSRIGLSEKDIVLGHIGRFVEVKNHDFLIEVFKKVNIEIKNSKLILVGSGPLEDQIKDKIAKNGLKDKVLFLGVRKDIPQILAAMDMFLLPSLFEGLGIVVIEAQAVGIKSLVCNNIPSSTNMNLNLLRYMELDIYKWKNYIVNNFLTEELGELLPFEKIYNHSNLKEYNIEFVVKKLESDYLN